jgi:ubiquinone/menaquinone biosynthesis C-methylase UbiE
MNQRIGVPTIAELDQLQRDPYYADITGFSRAFLHKHGDAMSGYGKLWGQDPFQLWSRRWEYPFTAQKAINHGQAKGGTLKFLDGGSGVTFFPYYVCSKVPGAQFVCVDTNESYPPMFEAINRTEGHGRVSFTNGWLQELKLSDGELDGVCCISVLEHTDKYPQIIKEFARVLKPGGLLVLTFDLSLDGNFELSKPVAADLLRNVTEYFRVEGVDLLQELDRMDRTSEILTTDHVKKTEPELLPWRYPMAKAVHDLIKGHGWTGGFRSKSVYCLEALKK